MIGFYPFDWTFMMHYHCFEIYINVVSTDILAEIGVFWGNFFGCQKVKELILGFLNLWSCEWFVTSKRSKLKHLTSKLSLLGQVMTSGYRTTSAEICSQHGLSPAGWSVDLPLQVSWFLHCSGPVGDSVQDIFWGVGWSCEPCETQAIARLLQSSTTLT